MPETKEETIHRLRVQAKSAQQKGQRLKNISVLIKHGEKYDKARHDAEALLAEAAALREHADSIERVHQSPVDSN